MSASMSMKVTRPTYPFRLRDPTSGRWMSARFLAKLKDIADCCAAWEIVAPAHTEPKPDA